MKKELYLWIRNLAVFYIFFTAVLNLVPDKKYEKYVRFFMGLLLIFMMSTPIFSILGKGQELTVSFLENFSRENKEKELQEFQNLQKIYLEKGYEMELEQKIRESLEKRGIESKYRRRGRAGRYFTKEKDFAGREKGDRR